jgi:anti-anti-sigma factor
MTAGPALHIGVAVTDEVVIVTPVGVLGISTAPKLRRFLLSRIAAQPQALIVDLNLMHVQTSAALSLFAAAARHSAEWADVPIVLVCDSPVAGRSLHTIAISRFLPVYPTMDVAVASIHRLPPRLQARRTVRRDARTLAPVREFVDQTCQQWEVGALEAVTRSVAQELVNNAITHAHTDATMLLHLRDRSLIVAVGDGSDRPPRLIPPGREPLQNHGYGLVIVDALARRWGSAPTADGKVVWAVLTSAA